MPGFDAVERIIAQQFGLVEELEETEEDGRKKSRTGAALRGASAVGNKGIQSVVGAPVAGPAAAPGRAVKPREHRPGMEAQAAPTQTPAPPAQTTQAPAFDESGFKRRARDGFYTAFAIWRSQIHLVDVDVNGPMATGGRMAGPSLEALFHAQLPQGTPEEREASEALAKAIGGGIRDWQNSIRVPALPWFPAFAAFPSPHAPQTPNVPTPLSTLIQIAVPSFTPRALSNAGVKRAVDDAITDIRGQFDLWRATKQVMLVMGGGPVPTFAPPYVPVGQVIGGKANARPGHLA